MKSFNPKKSFSLATIMVALFILMSPLSFAESNTKTTPFFTLEQETYFAENPHVYAYFSQLYPSKTPEQLAKEQGLSYQTNQKYLKLLASIGVIEQNRIDLSKPPVFLVKGVHEFSVNGPLSKKFSELMIKDYYEKLLSVIKNPVSESNHFLTTDGFWLTQIEYDQYKQALLDLEKKYINISIGNRKAKKSNAFRVSSLFSFLPNWEQTIFTEIRKDI